MADDTDADALRSLEDVAIVVTEDESESMRIDVGRRIRPRLTLPLDSEELLSEAKAAGAMLPDRLLQALRRLRLGGNSAGALLIRNVPTDSRFPVTPEDGILRHWSAYADEKAGHLIQEVVPIKGAEARQENSGTVYLELHTENGFHPHKPDFITLLCLRPDPAGGGTTVLGAAAEVLPKLSQECVALLRRPLFRLHVSSSFGAGRQLWTGPVAVLSAPHGSLAFLADYHAMEPLSEDADAALQELRRALLTSLRGAWLDTGDMLVIDNRAAVHGRAPFSARHDGTDRWLRRCLAVADIRRSDGVRAPGSRVCYPLTVIATLPLAVDSKRNRPRAA